jgi:hypothetical protein
MAIRIVTLQGSHEEMGYQYGKVMRAELSGALNTLKDYFICLKKQLYSPV